MGTSESKAGAQKFFAGVGGVLERGANGAINMMTMPVQIANTLANGASNFLNNPLSGIIIPVCIIGGIYVITQIK